MKQVDPRIELAILDSIEKEFEKTLQEEDKKRAQEVNERAELLYDKLFNTKDFKIGDRWLKEVRTPLEKLQEIKFDKAAESGILLACEGEKTRYGEDIDRLTQESANKIIKEAAENDCKIVYQVVSKSFWQQIKELFKKDDNPTVTKSFSPDNKLILISGSKDEVDKFKEYLNSGLREYAGEMENTQRMAPPAA